MKYGSDEQKKYYLPKILPGEHIWAQGYSEPNAGSDLASLATSAVPDGDDFIVNGQKIWTTLAHDATHIYLLVRTDKAGEEAGRHQLSAGRREIAGDHDTADPQHRRARGILRGVFRERARAAGQPGRRTQPGLDRREGAAVVRAHQHRQPAPAAVCAEAPRATRAGEGTVRRPRVRRQVHRAAARSWRTWLRSTRAMWRS